MSIKLSAKEKTALVAFIGTLNKDMENVRTAGVAVMKTLKKVSDTFSKYKATEIAELLEQFEFKYSAVTCQIYIGTIRKAQEQGIDITGMTNAEAQKAMQGAGSSGSTMDKDKALKKIKALAKKAQKDYGASLAEICAVLGIELE